MPSPRLEYQTLTKADVDGCYAVVCRIRPELPQDKMQRAQLAQALRAPGVDGRPLASDRFIREEVLEHDYPEAVERQVDDQMLPFESESVKKTLLAAREQKWFDDNDALRQLADERLGKALDLRPDELMQLVEILVKQRMAQMQGQDSGIQQLLGGAGPGGQMTPGAAPGMNPAAMPSQMSMTPEEVLPDPATLPGKQAQRGRPQNK